MGTSERLNDPYLIGGAGSPPDASVLPVQIDSRAYLIDTSRNTPMQERFRRSSIQLLNSQQNIDKGESALTTPEVWRRTYKSWHHGMGQKFADRDDSDEYRYDWSKGINPWERWEISLHHATARINAAGTIDGVQTKNHTVALLAGGTDVWVTDGTLEVTFTIGQVSVIASDGYVVYAYGADHKLRVLSIDNDGSVITVTAAPTIDVPITEQVVLLVFANFKLIAATVDGKVYDITAYIKAPPTTLPPAVYTPPVANTTFVAGCSGKKAIYMMEACGCRTVIHAFDLTRDTSSGPLDTLVYSGVAAELPDGEVGKALYNYLGYIAIGTSKGFRFSVVGDGITYGPLIETPAPVTAFEGQDRFLYYALSNFHGDSGIGRADLSQFVSDLQPAYASDLMSTGGHVNDEITFINMLSGDRLQFGMSTAGVWAEKTDTYVDVGEITLSAWSFNVVDAKTGLYVTSQTSTDTGGRGSLGIFYNQSENEVLLGDYQTAQQKFTLSGEQFYSAALHAHLEPNLAKDKTPKVYSVEMRATYVRGKASEWQLPCILHDEIEMDNGATQGRDVIADFQHLLSLVETGKTFQYIEDGQQWSVYATDFIWSPHERSETAGWQGVFTIYFREVR